jgi:hypothetical protein
LLTLVVVLVVLVAPLLVVLMALVVLVAQPVVGGAGGARLWSLVVLVQKRLAVGSEQQRCAKRGPWVYRACTFDNHKHLAPQFVGCV